MTHRFVALPKTANGKTVKTYLFKENRTTRVRQVLWGDWLHIDGDEADGWTRVIWGPTSDDPQTLYIPTDHTAETRPLEIIFHDVGQGDGAVLITPERDDGERIMVIDAGISHNMFDFLRKRFRPYNQNVRFHAAVITHPDEDHYAGFGPIFGTPQFGFDVIYHNGLVERPVPGTFEKLGGLVDDPASGRKYLQDLVITRHQIEQLFGEGVDIGTFVYPRVMRGALENPNIADFAMLSTEHGVKQDGRTWMPGFAPADNRGYQIEVMGPVAEAAAAGGHRLRKIGSYGETKNGHSVLLRLHYRRFKILFGGDLNDKAEKFLLTHYSGRERFPRSGTDAYREMIAEASNWFRAEIMKVCHHGSEKVTDAFIETVEPAAFVISSGDEEGHVHPRPDLLGRLGRLGRGDRPVILSTELQRSTREQEDREMVAELTNRIRDFQQNPTDSRRDRIVADIETLGGSNVTVYGTIYLKTDGERLITAFRIETGSEIKKWFTFEYVMTDDGDLELVD
jgi:beta-lactamase superfamily II metal-dependent hydrolase